MLRDRKVAYFKLTAEKSYRPIVIKFAGFMHNTELLSICSMFSLNSVIQAKVKVMGPIMHCQWRNH